MNEKQSRRLVSVVRGLCVAFLSLWLLSLLSNALQSMGKTGYEHAYRLLIMVLALLVSAVALLRVVPQTKRPWSTSALMLAATPLSVGWGLWFILVQPPPPFWVTSFPVVVGLMLALSAMFVSRTQPT